MGGRYIPAKNILDLYLLYTWFILTWCLQPLDRPQKHTRYILHLYSIYPHPSQNILDLYLIYTIWHGIYVVFIEDISSMLGEYKSSINRGWTSSIYYLFRFIMVRCLAFWLFAELFRFAGAFSAGTSGEGEASGCTGSTSDEINSIVVLLLNACKNSGLEKHMWYQERSTYLQCWQFVPGHKVLPSFVHHEAQRQTPVNNLDN